MLANLIRREAPSNMMLNAEDQSTTISSRTFDWAGLDTRTNRPLKILRTNKGIFSYVVGWAEPTIWGIASGEQIEGTEFDIDFEITGWHAEILSPLEAGESWLTAADICSHRAERLISAFEVFPPSYNRFLVQGALDYSRRVIARITPRHELNGPLLSEIRRFVTRLEGLYRQYCGQASVSFSRLGLRLIEDRFEIIQERASQLGVFPRLQDASLQQLLSP